MGNGDSPDLPDIPEDAPAAGLGGGQAWWHAPDAAGRRGVQPADELPGPIMPGLQQFTPVTNVRDYGARGDGTGDDTWAVQEALNRTPDGGTIYVPAGVYPVQGLELFERRCLTMVGEGQCSLLRRSGTDSTTGILHAVGCLDLTVRRLGFDANGLEPRAADTDLETAVLRFQRCEGVDVVETVMDDSAPPHLPRYSGNFISDPWRTGIAFDYLEVEVTIDFPTLEGARFDAEPLPLPIPAGRFRPGHARTFTSTSNEPNRDIRILRNRLTHLGVLVRHATNARIEGNTFRFTNGYGIVVGGRGTHLSSIDVTVNHNEIMDPLVGGIAIVASAASVPPQPVDDMLVEIKIIRVRVTGNLVVKSAGSTSRTSPDGHGIFVGLAEEALPGTPSDVGDLQHPVSGILMRDIVVDSNHVEFAREDDWPARDAFGIVFAWKLIDARWFLAHVEDLDGRWAGGGVLAPAQEAPVEGAPLLHQSLGFFHVVVSRNTVIGCRTSGIRAQRLCRSVVRDNLIQECTAGLHLELAYFCLASGNHAVTTGNRPYLIAESYFSSFIGNVAAPTEVRRRGAYSDAGLWPSAVWTSVSTQLPWVIGGVLRLHAGDQKDAGD